MYLSEPVRNLWSWIVVKQTSKASIDQGAKKPLKDVSYINFNYESKTFIRLYSEFCLEPLSRTLGILLSMFIKTMMTPLNPLSIVSRNLYIAKRLTLGLSTAWAVVTGLIARQDKYMLEKIKKLTYLKANYLL